MNQVAGPSDTARSGVPQGIQGTDESKVGRRRKRSWKFSHGGVCVFVIFLFLPILAGAANLLRKSEFLPSALLTVLVVSPLLAIVWFVGIRPLLQYRFWRLSRSWYEGLFGIGGLQLFHAAFVAITGYTPVRYHSVPVDRSEALVYVLLSVPFLVLAVIARVLEKRYGIGADDRRTKS